MPDLDFAGLAEESRQAFKPRFDEVVRRARRRRRRWLGALGALVVTISAGGVAVGLLGAASPPDGLSRGSARTPVAAGDIWHLYQLTETCDTDGCHDHFAASADRGASWSLRPPPGPPGSERQILAAANTTVVVAADQGIPNSTTRWVTTDAGRTWRAATVDSRMLTQTDVPAYVDGSRAMLVRPGTGRLAVAPAPIPLERARPFDGGAAFWLVGTTGEGRLSTAVSGDFGRSWEVQALPRDIGFRDFSSANGVDLYALYASEDTFDVFASRDGGRTWTQGAIVPSQPGEGRLLATRDGALWLSTPTGVLSSTDRGRTFHGPGFADIGQLAFDTSIDGLYVASNQVSRPRVWVSEDGRDWVELPG